MVCKASNGSVTVIEVEGSQVPALCSPSGFVKIFVDARGVSL